MNLAHLAKIERDAAWMIVSVEAVTVIAGPEGFYAVTVLFADGGDNYYVYDVYVGVDDPDDLECVWTQIENEMGRNAALALMATIAQ